MQSKAGAGGAALCLRLERGNERLSTSLRARGSTRRSGRIGRGGRGGRGGRRGRGGRGGRGEGAEEGEGGATSHVAPAFRHRRDRTPTTDLRCLPSRVSACHLKRCPQIPLFFYPSSLVPFRFCRRDSLKPSPPRETLSRTGSPHRPGRTDTSQEAPNRLLEPLHRHHLHRCLDQPILRTPRHQR